jgi:hypothetical protein
MFSQKEQPPQCVLADKNEHDVRNHPRGGGHHKYTMERIYPSSQRTERIEDRGSGGYGLTRKGSSRISLVVSFNPSESAFETGVTI